MMSPFVELYYVMAPELPARCALPHPQVFYFEPPPVGLYRNCYLLFCSSSLTLGLIMGIDGIGQQPRLFLLFHLAPFIMFSKRIKPEDSQ